MIDKIVFISTECIKYSIKSALNISKYDRVKVCIYNKKNNIITCGASMYEILTPTPDKLDRLDEDIYIFIPNNTTEKIESSLEQGIQSVLENVIVKIKLLKPYEYFKKVDSDVFEIIHNKDFTPELEHVDPASVLIPEKYSCKDPFTGMYSFWSRGKQDETTDTAFTNIKRLIPDYNKKKQVILLYSLQHSAISIDGEPSYFPSVEMYPFHAGMVAQYESVSLITGDPSGYQFFKSQSLLNTVSYLYNFTEEFVEFYILNQLGEVISKTTMTKKDPQFTTLRGIERFSMDLSANTISFMGRSFQSDRVSGAFIDYKLYSFDNSSEENVKKVLKDFTRTKLNKAYNQKDYDHVFDSIPAVEYQQPEDNNTMYKATFDTKVKISNPTDILEITNKIMDVDNIDLPAVFNVRYYQMLFGCRIRLSGKAQYLFHIPENEPNMYILEKEKEFHNYNYMSIPFCYSGNLIIDISNMELEALFYNDPSYYYDEKWEGKVPLVIYDSVFILKDMEQFNKLFVEMRNFSYKSIILRGCSFYIKETGGTIYRTINNEGNKTWYSEGIISNMVPSYYNKSYFNNIIYEYISPFDSGFGGSYAVSVGVPTYNTFIRVDNNNKEIELVLLYDVKLYVKNNKVIIGNTHNSSTIEFDTGNDEYIDIELYKDFTDEGRVELFVVVNNDYQNGKTTGRLEAYNSWNKFPIQLKKGIESIRFLTMNYLPRNEYVNINTEIVDIKRDNKQFRNTIRKLMDFSKIEFVEYDFPYYFTKKHSRYPQGKGGK